MTWSLATFMGALLQPWKRRRSGQATIGRPISVVMPISASDGARPQRDRSGALHSLLALQPAAQEIIVSVDRQPEDGRLASALRIGDSRESVRVVAATTQPSANAKVDAMSAGLKAATHELVLFCDDNVLVEPSHLDHFLKQSGPNIGLVSAAAIGIKAENFWAELELVYMNGQFARLHLAGDFIGCSGAMGKTVLISKTDIVKAGGLDRIGGHCCEDAALTRNIKAVGLTVALSDLPILQPIATQRLIDVWRRHRRWLSCRRRYLPIVFLAEGLFSTVLTSITGAISGGYFLQSAVGGAAATVALMGGFDAALRHLKRWPSTFRSPAAWTVGQLLFLPLWFSAVWARTVTWYGRSVPVFVQER